MIGRLTELALVLDDEESIINLTQYQQLVGNQTANLFQQELKIKNITISFPVLQKFWQAVF